MIDQLLKEKIETLDGSRNRGAIRRAAVRIDDVSALLELQAKLKSAKAAGAAPTKAEFDALVDDVTAIFNRLTAIADALQARLLP
ncbi:hypothetical protein [Allomesorhizobium alhagi]|uniref:Uncharacterized protein n=1 Tax=Mesorhizobium alhagi CCNWXJ12-2 TaxID=1107882 RepID=H0HNH3_9HYPH|nr:hypothetical protein [Mesorhizobium alhagi]EHK57745.1 hypothetical protein MAXJ12_08479 [Mesorhizobium alhagi CCNWXJ12-2]